MHPFAMADRPHLDLADTIIMRPACFRSEVKHISFNLLTLKLDFRLHMTMFSLLWIFAIHISMGETTYDDRRTNMHTGSNNISCNSFTFA